MKSLFLICIAVVAASPAFGASLLYQGHGSVRLESSSGTVVYIDPYVGEGYDKEADLILVTHEHRDHNNIDLVKQTEKTVILRSKDMLIDGKYQTKKVGGIKIEAVPAYNKNHKKEECVGYIVTIDGKKCYFSGDTSTTDAMPGFKKRKLDYAFLCMDGKYNMGPEEATECAKVIGAKHSVPYHMAPGKLFDEETAKKLKVDSLLIVPAGTKIDL
jgi:L-ascorbate metabolism protein UlaG (beta-lactamase superfamily)